MVTQVLLGAILVILHLDPVVSALHTMLATLSAITATIAMVEAVTELTIDLNSFR